MLVVAMVCGVLMFSNFLLVWSLPLNFILDTMGHFDLQHVSVVIGPNCSKEWESHWNRIAAQLSRRYLSKASLTVDLVPITHNQLIIYPCDRLIHPIPTKVHDVFLLQDSLSDVFPVFPGVDTSVFTFQVTNDSRKIHLTEHYQFLESDPVISRLYTTWTFENGFDMVDREKNPLERRKNLNGRKLVLSQALYWPFIFKRADGSFGGISIDIINNFQQSLNFTYELVPSPDGTYGTFRNQSWTGFVGQLINGSTDVCIATLTITHARREVIDFSIPLMWTDLGIFIFNPNDKVNFLTYFAPFTIRNWIALLLLLVVATLILDWAAKQSLLADESFEFGRFKALCFVVGSISFARRWSVSPTTTSMRIIFITLMFTGCLISYHWKAALISVMTVEDIKYPFEDLKGLIDSPYEVVFGSGGFARNMFAHSKDPIFSTIWKDKLDRTNDFSQYIGANLSEHYMKILEHFPLKAMITDTLMVRKFDEFLSCQVIQIPYTFMHLPLAFGYTKGSPWRILFDHELRKMFQNGIYHRFRYRYRSPEPNCLPEPGKPLSYHKMIDLWVIFVGGLIGSVLLFVGEVACYTCPSVLQRLWNEKRPDQFDDIG